MREVVLLAANNFCSLEWPCKAELLHRTVSSMLQHVVLLIIAANLRLLVHTISQIHGASSSGST